MQNDFLLETFEDNTLLRQQFVKRFQNQCDSVVLVASKNDYYSYFVFEPNVGGNGTFSLMCGNGLKAAVSMIPKSQVKIKTPAGMFMAKKSGFDNEIFVGKFVCGNAARQRFMKSTGQKVLLNTVKQQFAQNGITYKVDVCLGYNAESSLFIGEPHLAVYFLDPLPIIEMVAIAKKISILIRNSDLFTEEVNVTFVSFKSLIDNMCTLAACTFERNLGNNPDVALTGSCGTGAMAASNYFYKHALKKRQTEMKFLLDFPKATLKVSIRKGTTVIFGDTSYESF